MEQNDNQANKNEIQFGYYLVAFIDVLDQRTALKALTDLPSDEEEKKEFIEKLKETFGVVDGVRKLIKSSYEAYLRTNESLLEKLNEEQKDIYKKLRKTELKFQYFGDTILTFCSLANNLGITPINAVYNILITYGNMLLISLAAKRPLRGAIEIGIGGEFFPGEIYGSCLNEAFRLECEIAQYPRIIIGKNVIAYLLSQKEKEGDDVATRYQKRLAETCLELITEDVDGYYIVDYLGKRFREFMKRAKVEETIIKDAFAFVQEQAEKWQKGQNTKLAFRYNLLRQYFGMKLIGEQVKLEETGDGKH